MSLPPSLQYIIIHCGTNNIGHNDPEVFSDDFINLARVIKKKYNSIKVIISSLLPRYKANSQKCALVIAANIYLKVACNTNSFSFVELDSWWIVEVPSAIAFQKWHKIWLWIWIFITQNLVMKNFDSSLSASLTHETSQEPHYAYGCKSAKPFTLNKEEFPTLFNRDIRLFEMLAISVLKYKNYF